LIRCGAYSAWNAAYHLKKTMVIRGRDPKQRGGRGWAEFSSRLSNFAPIPLQEFYWLILDLSGQEKFFY